jgi:septum site-determining protein MinC
MQSILDDAFQLKADFIPLTVLKITRADLDGIQTQLENTIQQAPKYFTDAPVVIDLGGIDAQDTLDIGQIASLLKQKNIIPIGIRGLADTQQDHAKTLGLAILKSPPKKEKKPSARTLNTNPDPVSPTKIITKPIRAGTQVYAKGGDLLVLAGVNAGAECFADGNIHVYGPLRGRALAGVSGDTQARIFCQSLDAELIAIAGHYEVKENITPPTNAHSMIQIYLNDKKLIIDTI